MKAQLIYRGDVAEVQLIPETEGEKHIVAGIAGFKGTPRLTHASSLTYSDQPKPRMFYACQGGYYRIYEDQDGLVITIPRSDPPAEVDPPEKVDTAGEES